MKITRRYAMKTLGGALCTAPLLAGMPPVAKQRAKGSPGWTADWDRAVLECALSHWDRSYDATASLLTAHRGPEYNYHSGLNYDFASGLFYSVQERGCVLGAIAFRSDGGDKHPSLDPIRNETFRLTRLSAQFHFGSRHGSWRILVDGKPLPERDVRLPLSSRIIIDTTECIVCLQFRTASFGESVPALRLTYIENEGQNDVRIDLMFFEAPSEQTLHWADAGDAGGSFTLAVSDKPTSLTEFGRLCASTSFTQEQIGNSVRYKWASPAAPLEITVLRGAQPVVRMDAAYDEQLAGNPVPTGRLSDEKIVP